MILLQWFCIDNLIDKFCLLVHTTLISKMNAVKTADRQRQEEDNETSDHTPCDLSLMVLYGDSACRLADVILIGFDECFI